MSIEQQARKRIIAALIGVISVLFAATAVCEESGPDLENGERKSRACLSCHAVDNFSEFEADALTVELTAIVAGETSHMALPPVLSQQDLADIAAYLVSANSSTDG